MNRSARLRTCRVSIWLLLCGICGCTDKSPANQGNSTAVDKQTLILQLNWYPEAEHGGYYAALVEGCFAEEGLEVEILPGGRATPVAAELSLGRAQFAISNAADVLLFREQGADIVAVMAAMQDNPRCIIVRKDSGIERFDQLAGHTLQLGAGRPFVEFLKQQGVLEGVTVVPYFGTVTQLVTDPNMAQQGYVFSEPLLAEQAGTPVRSLMVSKLGFNPYASVLVTTGTMLREHPEQVERMVRASIAGWRKYLRSPNATNAHILAQNKHGLTGEVLSYGVEQMKPLVLPRSLPPHALGTMTPERWQQLAEQLQKLGLISAERVDPQACYELVLPADAR